MSVFIPHRPFQTLPVRVAAARLTGKLAALAALDLVAGWLVNTAAEPDVREPWTRFLPGAGAVLVFGVLTVALLRGVGWARRATFLAAATFLVLVLFGLLMVTVVLAGHEVPVLGPGWYYPFRCAVGILELMLCVALAVTLTGGDRGEPT